MIHLSSISEYNRKKQKYISYWEVGKVNIEHYYQSRYMPREIP